MDVRDVPNVVRAVGRAGFLRPARPSGLLGAGRALRQWGSSLAGGIAATAALHPDDVFVVDERGTLTRAEVHHRTNAIAWSLHRRGVRTGDLVAVLARNHRGFVEATLALAKLGARALYLNTGFAGPQLAEVLEREGPVAVIVDEDLADLLGSAAEGRLQVLSWVEDTGAAHDLPTLDDLATASSGADLPPPRSASHAIILTSGTTGTPKGAPREQESGALPGLAMLERIPYRHDDTSVIAAPLFHSWGFGNLALALALGATVVLRRRFDPEQALADVARHRAQVLVAVPVMLQRILELPEDVRRRHDTSSLRIVPLSGSAIPAGVVERWTAELGENLYNLYGSTEVGWVSIATPEDLRDDPTTAGRPPLFTDVRLLDADGREVPPGRSGRIFVKSALLFDGYTDGRTKEVVDGYMSTGDTGRFDAEGRLHVEGRDDEMIVSGGENVFPREVEDLLSHHPDVADVAVVGVDDEEFGQRLKAFVVPRPGAGLDAAAVRAHVRSNLARFKVPRDVELVDEIPRNATGKVLKRDLR